MFKDINGVECFAVTGDVHGEIGKLQKILDYLDRDYPGIDIYSTGDLVDRGPDSKAVIQLCIDRNIKAVRGNHDDVFIRVIKGEFGALNGHLNRGMGGRETAKSYGYDYLIPNSSFIYKDLVPQSHKDYFNNLPLYRYIKTEKKEYVIIHAGIDNFLWQVTEEGAGRDSSIRNKLEFLVREHEDEILWVHKKNNLASLGPNVIQVFGHLPVDSPVIEDHFIMIDTGAGKGVYPLSCIILPENKIIQAS